jgi:mycothiol synthase
VTQPLPEGYTLRGGRYPDDVDAVADLFAACDRVDVGFEDVSRPWIDDNWRADRFVPALDVALVHAADGSLAASGECTYEVGGAVDTFNRVHPDHRGRGLGTWLIEWSQARAVEHVSAGAVPTLQIVTPGPDRAARALMADHDYQLVRTFWHMDRSLKGLDGAVVVPAGIRIAAATVPKDLPELHACMEEAFEGHFGSVNVPFEEWRAQAMDAPDADPGLFLLAWDGGLLAGAAMSAPADGIDWIRDIAVRATWRGRGIGEALMRASFAALVARGFARARLNVDAGNETGATRLYERVGMTVHREWLVYEKPLVPG